MTRPCNLVMLALQEYVLEDKEDCEHIHQRRHLFGPAGEEMQDDVGDDSHGNTLRD